MKKIIKLMVGLLLLGGIYSCATSPRESAASESLEEMSVTDSELDAQFTADRLPRKRLDALEVRARQKLMDCMDYLTLMNNPDLDSTFRAQAMVQVSQLFIQPQHMDALLEDLVLLTDSIRQRQPVQKIHYTIQEAVVTHPLQPVTAKQYRGVMTFLQVAEVNRQEVTQKRKADIWVKKVTKQFGDEQEAVWEVFLGSID